MMLTSLLNTCQQISPNRQNYVQRTRAKINQVSKSKSPHNSKTRIFHYHRRKAKEPMKGGVPLTILHHDGSPPS